jgi:hypothetical protein
MRAASLSVHFEAGDLFVLTRLDNFACFAEAQEALVSGVSLILDDDWISVACPGREPKPLCSDDNDECGRWPDGANRSCQEDAWTAQLSVPVFLALRPDMARLRPVWGAIAEWEKGADGRFIRTLASTSGSIDKLAPR